MWMALEVLLSEAQRACAAGIFSFGCLLHCLVTGRPLAGLEQPDTLKIVLGWATFATCTFCEGFLAIVTHFLTVALKLS